jgi:putative acyl-CoA dehydrogenase
MNLPRSADTRRRASSRGRCSTHNVTNQAALPAGNNAFAGDIVLRSAIKRKAPSAPSRCLAVGRLRATRRFRNSRAWPIGRQDR